MADNVAITAGSGTSVATDDVGGVHYQLVKLAYGALDAANVVASTLGLPTSIAQPASTTGSLAATGSVTAAVSNMGVAHVRVSGTYGGVSGIIEASDDSGTTYFAVSAVREDTGVADSEALAIPDNTTRVWVTAVAGFTNLRFRVTARSSGTIDVRISPGAAVAEPNVSTTAAPCSTATLSNVASSASSVSLLAANTARKGAIVVNDSASVLYVKYGATASATSFTYKLNAGETLEVPVPVYRGAIDGIWVTATGSARITELT